MSTRVTAVESLVEIEHKDGVNVTAAESLVEIEPGVAVFSTALLGYVEIEHNPRVRVSALMGYVEIGPRPISPSTFTINGEIPPYYARPDRKHPPVLRYPSPKKMVWPGEPVRAVGLPYAEIGRSWINQEGIDWWLDLFGSSPYIDASVTLYDPFENGWVSGSCHVWRPTFMPKENLYAEFVIKLTGIEKCSE